MPTRTLILLLLLCGWPTAAWAQTPAGAQQPESAQEILARAVDAAGGRAAFQRIRNFRVRTESMIYQPQTRLKLVVTETVELPDKTRQVMELTGGERIQVLNGEKSWKSLNGEISGLSEAEKREMQRGLFRDTISLFRRQSWDDLNIAYLDREVLGDQANHVVQVAQKQGDFFRLYIDSKTYLISKKAYHGAPEVGLALLEEIYSDYREVDGIKLPFRTEVRANGRKFIESRVLNVEFNLDLPEDFFLKP